LELSRHQFVLNFEKFVLKQIRKWLAFAIQVPKLDFFLVVNAQLVVVFVKNHVIGLLECLKLEN
jgi:hypothetical protein